jgi:H+-transporting ATPase
VVLTFLLFFSEMGVSVKMITGDQLVIAKEVAHRLGLPRTILPASKLTDPSVSIEELTDRYIERERKEKIVEMIEKRR